MRSLVLAAAAALLFVSAASAATTPPPPTPAGPYTADARGNCHAKNGQIVAKSNCAAPHLLASTVTTTTTTTGAPHCDPAKSIPCGKTCIAKNLTCHH